MVGLAAALLRGQERDAALDALFSSNQSSAPIAGPSAPPKSRPVAAELFDLPIEDSNGFQNGSSKASRAQKKARKAVKPAVTRDLLKQGAEELSDRPRKRKKVKEGPNGDAASLKVYGFDKTPDEPTNDEEPIIHESLLPGYAKSKAAKGTKKAREAADAEAPAVRAARTVFVGNVPLACVTSKKLRKALLSHLIASLPEEAKAGAKAETIRFRSLPLAESVSDKAPAKPMPSVPANHGDKRTAAFKARGGLLNSTAAEEDDEGARLREQEKRFLTTAQKRKVAAITGEINTNAESCVAFVVLDSPETARAVIISANGSDFEDRTLRVDAVRDRESKDEKAAAVPAEERKRIAEEEKRTCYVGGLDFGESEEKLRVWVEETLVRERGEPEQGAWVERVRIVRDSATGLGKGFAYVLMQDRDCVDELLALPPEQCKLSKRKLRLQRCKSAAKLEVEAQKAAKAVAAKEQKQALAKLPRKASDKPVKRDSASVKALASKLEGLDKDERKALKASDPERLARRAAKKQAKIQHDRKERKRQARIAKAPKP